MGQMTYGVMLGVNAGEAPESMEDGWSDLLDDYSARGLRPTHPAGNTNPYNVIGLWIALGQEGEDGVQPLDIGFALDEFLNVAKYRKAYDRAQKAWVKFAAWAEKRGHTFGQPRLWLVQTEVG